MCGASALHGWTPREKREQRASSDAQIFLVSAHAASVYLDSRELHRLAEVTRVKLDTWVAQSGRESVLASVR